MTDLELQLALAKMLPEKIHVADVQEYGTANKKTRFYWTDSNNSPEWEDWSEIQYTEWLHICWLIEKTLTWNQIEAYRDALSQVSERTTDIPIESCVEHWSWQQRADALIAVKGGK